MMSFRVLTVLTLLALGWLVVVLAGGSSPEASAAPLQLDLLTFATTAIGLGVVPLHRYVDSRGRGPRERVVLLGSGAVARKLATALEAVDPGSVQGFITEGDDAGHASVVHPACQPLLGNLASLSGILAEVRPDRIVVAVSEWRNRVPVHDLLRWSANGTAVETASQAYERLTGKLAIESLPPSYLVFSGAFRRHPALEVSMRALSLVTALVGGILTLPLMALIAVAIKLDTAGPALFVQERAGLRGKRFRLYKFRTMVPSDGERSEWARDNADRVTRVGHWIRKFRLDELPQFWNILRGDMDLVGPRPHPVANVGLFSEHIPYYELRASIRPGLTGWAQVRNGYANNLDEETEKMRYDLYYIKNRSLWLDLRIILETISVVLFGKQSGHEIEESLADVPAALSVAAAPAAERRGPRGLRAFGPKAASIAKGKRISA